VETLGGVMTPLITRNTTIPTKRSEVFSTAADSQPAVDIHILQGERKMAGDNRTLGRFQLMGIPPAPRGVPQIEVTFDIDANGILNVSAKDKATNKEQKIEIKASSGLDKADVERMVREASSHEAEDKAKAELVEARNKADQLCYQTEKFIKDNDAKVPADLKTKAEAAIKDVREALKESGDIKPKLDKAVSDLESTSHKIAEEVYKKTADQGAAQTNAGATGGAPGGESKPEGKKGEKPDGEVIDADFKVVDDNKK
jgi:molecular chaperone DnaK